VAQLLRQVVTHLKRTLTSAEITRRAAWQRTVENAASFATSLTN
jgi:hypothetical protein